MLCRQTALIAMLTALSFLASGCESLVTAPTPFADPARTTSPNGSEAWARPRGATDRDDRSSFAFSVLALPGPFRPGATASASGAWRGSLSSAKGPDSTTSFKLLLHTLKDVYAQPILVVATSPEEWIAFQTRLLEGNCFIVIPPPQPPDNVDWSREAVLLVGMRDPGGAYEVRIERLARHGRHLATSVEIDWDHRLDPIEYAPTEMVKFDKWPGLKGMILIGAEDVTTALASVK